MMHRRSRERGGALLVAVVITLMVVAISGAFISHAMVRQRNSTNLMFGSQAVTAAEAGAALYVQDLNKNYWASRITPAPAAIPSMPPVYRDGFLGSSNQVPASAPGRDTLMVNRSFYRIWREPMGENAIDDNGDGAPDDEAEGSFVRLWIEGHAGGAADLSNPNAPKYRGGAKRTIEVVLTHKDSKITDYGIYAGNESGDPYTMVFESVTGKSDQTRGDIYSGGSIAVRGNAALQNDAGNGPASRVKYKDSFTDTSGAPDPGYVKGAEINPDIAGGRYEDKATSSLTRFNADTNPTGQYVNVSADLEAFGDPQGSYKGVSNNNGMTKLDGSQGDMGRAERQIVNPDHPAHMFRKEPSTTIAANSPPRVQGYSGMKPDKPNYFLEDPSKTANNGGTALAPWGQNTGNTGLRVEVKPNANDKVYYIDGNLWASNGPAYTFQWLNATNSDMKITIVVKGNVYLTDNLIYDQIAKAGGRKDALAIIAIKDPNYPSASAADVANPNHAAYNPAAVSAFSSDPMALINAAREWNKLHGSGNIFFGDPGGGTTERFESFMYAENNFYDNNLTASGTVETNIYGNMTAGNQILINRKTTPANQFRPLKVQYDNRIRTGQVSLPGLPESPGAVSESWKVVSWRQVASRPKNWGDPPPLRGMHFIPE